MWVFEWTGEEFLPATRDASLVYRQVHSYLFAARFVEGRSVLDARAGDGSGAQTLAQTARTVVAVVAGERLAAHANEKYKAPNLRFTPVLEGGPFDVVVGFDAPVELEFKSLLKPGGLLIVSARMPENLQGRLQTRFRKVQLFGQADRTGSCIWPLGQAPPATSEVEVLPNQPRVPASVIAIASDADLAQPQNLHVLVDEANELLRDRNQRIEELIQNEACQETVLRQRETQLAGHRESLAHLQEAVAWHEARIASLTEARDFMEREVGHYRKALESAEEALAWRTQQAEELQAGVINLQAGIESLQASLGNHQATIASHEEALAWRASQVESLTAELAAKAAEAEAHHHSARSLGSELDSIKASRGWKLIQRLRSIRDSLTNSGKSRGGK